MTRTRCILAAIALAAMVLCCLGHADDSALTVMGGGAVAMYAAAGGHPDVSMDRCIVNADVYADESLVRCEFVFTNHGAGQTVPMGFPARGAFGDSGAPGYSPRLESFRTWVDGAPTPTDLRPGVQEDREQPARSWYTKRVQFAAGQTRAVRVEYTQPNGEDSMGGRWFPYAVSTGASWRGPIGELQMTLRWMEPWAWDPMQPSYAQWRFQLSDDGRRASWLGTDIEPLYDISFYFWPGWRMHLEDNAWLVRPSDGGFDVPLRVLSDLLQAEKIWDPGEGKGYLALPDGRTVVLSPGQSHARVKSWSADWRPSVARVALPHAPYLEDGQLWTPAAPILSHLGYRVTRDAANRRFDIARP